MVRQHRKRYDLRCEPDGTWTVYDIFTGMAYNNRDHIAFAMDEEFARTLVEHLNREYVKQRFKD
ncbi:MAG: hypothetical protein EON58_05510 [Alphaproteobacteria bacterium]|nr:MAG: hypothetical protein EON58_05510 [Alphaproteobacteria bacterium]